ncbi:glycosyltransferase family 4 protein [Halobacterium salinarum]|uniref:Glycosyltransferase involved in cell wall bisynthesis n=1 Tax=Halobacterium salinarum (strain ATCC 33171 / DSM 3754 / JCM 8978 / NBRC 102687 / NCIMB 764 / 91-R6) TaxID=2597657 RepID=A0A4D6GUH7_HALS9|nr:glycosyltransferase family 4 protein [Halobacterium salinarum]QCC43992.1 putative glycosyltransferase, type 1 [Halobacterium salinarum]TYO71780.1 Glycosyltransferase involved in cell wall bisynthesis [Halobacterium salinarum DSM 3754]
MAEAADCSILFISQYFPPETGAAPTRVSELTSRWSERGHDVTVLTSAPDYPEGEIYDGYSNKWMYSEDRDNVRVISVKTIPASNQRFGRRALKFIWFMFAAVVAGLWIKRHDIVVSTSPQPLTGPAGWLVARVKRSKFVFEVRDLWPESITSLSDLNEVILRPLGWAIEFTYRHADRVVVVSEGFQEEIEAVGVDNEDVLVHHNGVDPEYFDVDESDWSLDSDIVEELQRNFVVSYVGTLGKAHGLSVVLDAAEELDDVLFLLVGTGAEADALKAEAERRSLDSVQFAGRHPKKHVPELLALSDAALVHLKDKELFRTAIPSKMFEAMAAELPILLGVEGTAARILENGDAGITFQPEDGDELAAAIRNLRDDSFFREELGKNGRQLARESFSWNQIALAYSRDLRAVVENKSN